MFRDKNNPFSYSFDLTFLEEMAPEDCFEKLFLTIDYRRLNGCNIYYVKSNKGDKGRYRIKIAFKNRDYLSELLKCLTMSDKFMEFISIKDISISELTIEANTILLAKVENDIIKTEKNTPPVISKALRQIKEKEKFASSYEFEKIPCISCNEDTLGLGFCPSCHRQNKFIDRFALSVLGIIILYTIFTSYVSLKNIWGLAWDINKFIFVSIAIVRTVGYSAGMALIYYYKKPGYYILIGTKVIDTFLRFTIYGSSIVGFFIETAVTLIFIYVLDMLLDKDLIYMKNSIKSSNKN